MPNARNIDGGYAWIVLIATFLSMVIIDGVCFTFGIFYVELVNHYNCSRADASWISSIFNGLSLMFGPVCAGLVNKYGCRRVIMVGGLLCCVTLSCSILSPSIHWMIAIYGVLAGTSFGFVMVPPIVMAGLYFEKRRALATGITTCGSGVGALIFSILVRYLIKEYGWQGAMLIKGGIALHLVVCGALFRELEIEDYQSEFTQAEEESHHLCTIADDNSNTKRHKCDTMTEHVIPTDTLNGEEAKENDTDTSGILTGSKIAPDDVDFDKNGLLHNNELDDIHSSQPAQTCTSQTSSGIGKDECADSCDCSLNVKSGEPEPTLAWTPQPVKKLLPRSIDASSHAIKSVTNLIPNPGDSRNLHVTERPRFMTTMTSRTTSRQKHAMNESMHSRTVQKARSAHNILKRKRSRDHSNPEDKMNEHEFMRKIRETPNLVGQGLVLSRYLRSQKPIHVQHQGSGLLHSRKDLFFSGSLHHLAEYRYPDALSTTDNEVDDLSDQDIEQQYEESVTDFTDVKIIQTIKDMINFSLLKAPLFLIYCISCWCFMIGFFVPIVFLPDLIIGYGYEDKVSIIVPIIGIANTIARVAIGLTADFSGIDPVLLNAIGVTMGGFSACFLPVVNSYLWIATMTALFSCALAIFVSLRSIIAVELVGLDHLTNAFGLIALFQGIATIVGPPLAGILRSATGSYTYPFYVAGGSIVLSGLLCFFIRITAMRQTQSQSKTTTEPFNK